MEFITILLIGIGLSMDTFSLSLCYGVLGLEENKKKTLAILVGIFHFIMPLLGIFFGNLLTHFILVDMRYIVFIIFMILGFEMLYERDKDKFLLFNFVSMIIFAFTVSIDSFSAGIGLKYITDNTINASIVFSLTSLIFTYFGLIIGNYIGYKYSEYSKILGGIILITFALYHLFN